MQDKQSVTTPEHVRQGETQAGMQAPPTSWFPEGHVAQSVAEPAVQVAQLVWQEGQSPPLMRYLVGTHDEQPVVHS